MVGASVAEFDFGSHGREKVARGLNVANLRDVFEDDRLVSEQGSGHAGKGGIFCAADADRAEQRLTAANYEFVHECLFLGEDRTRWRKARETWAALDFILTGNEVAGG